ncbi:MAG: DUF3667 domain-containing protein [Cyclobacteriaceae bacterium]|jgi:hypothetical protein
MLTCRSCGNEFEGNYCNQCGEKVLVPSDRSFRSLLNTITRAVTFADNKFVDTLLLVLRKPGFVSSEIAEGRRVNYLAPISLFFVLNLIYFLFPLIQLFNASLNTQLLSLFGAWLRGPLTGAVLRQGVNLETFTLLYNLKTVGLAKLLVMVFVLLASLPLNLLYRKSNRFFTDHVGYMIEVACFNLFVNAILLTILINLTGLGAQLNELTLTMVFIVTNLYFLLRSGYAFYAEGSWRLAIKSVLMIGVMKLALEVYRLILFFLTIWTM